MPFASCYSSLEGCQHALGPYRAGAQREPNRLPLCLPGCFRPQSHYFRFGLVWYVFHAFTFLSPFTHTAFPCSSATMETLTATLLPASTSAALNGPLISFPAPLTSTTPASPLVLALTCFVEAIETPLEPASPFLRGLV